MIALPLPPDRAARLLAAVVLRTQGGPGSGNFGHAGRPGEVGGSASASTKFQATATEIAKRHGFPPDDVIFSNERKAFQMGGETFEESANFNESTGKITLRQPTLQGQPPSEIEEIMVHEIMHRDWRDVKSTLGLGTDTGPWVFADPDAKLIANIMNPIEAQALAREDGVSGYSRSYWRNVTDWPEQGIDKASYRARYLQAVNETLAEISKNDVPRALPLGLPPTERWRALHTAVKNVAKKIRDTRTYD